MDIPELLGILKYFKRNIYHVCGRCKSEDISFRTQTHEYYCRECWGNADDLASYDWCSICGVQDTYGDVVLSPIYVELGYNRLCKKCFVNELEDHITPCAIKPAKK